MRFHGLLFLSIFLAVTAAPSAPLPAQGLRGSYVDLRGARLKRFEKTEAASEARRPIAIALPVKLLNDGSFERLGRSKIWLTMLHRGVRYYVRRDNPYFVQSRRKAAKKAKGVFTLKGQVKKLRWQGTRIWAVKVESLQVRAPRRGKSKRRAPSRKKTSARSPRASGAHRSWLGSSKLPGPQRFLSGGSPNRDVDGADVSIFPVRPSSRRASGGFPRASAGPGVGRNTKELNKFRTTGPKASGIPG